MRTLLPVMLLAAAASIAHAEKTTIAFDELQVSGKVDAKTVTATLERSKVKLLACHERALGAADVIATFSIEANGKVVTADAPASSRSLSTCLTRALAKLRFARPKDGLPVGVSVRLRFATGAGDVSAELYGGLGGTFGGPPSIGLGSISPLPGRTPGTGAGYGVAPRRSAVSFGAPRIRGDLDAQIIRRYVKRQLSRITSCYESELLATPGLAGKLTVDFTIGADGKVAEATATGVHANVEACVATAIRQLGFPKPRTPTTIAVSYPMILAPVK